MYLKQKKNKTSQCWLNLHSQNACVTTLKKIFVVSYVNLFMMTFSDHVVTKYSIK